MKKVIICMTLLLILILSGCGADGNELSASKKTNEEETTTSSITTTVTTTTITTTVTTTTVKVEKTELNEYDESKNTTYTVLSLDFSIPYYWTLDEKSKEKENFLRFYSQPKECDVAILTISCVDGKFTAESFEKSKDSIQKDLISKETALSDPSNEVKNDGEMLDLPVRLFSYKGITKEDKVYRKYVAFAFDEVIQKIYILSLYQPDNSKYDYVSDFGSVLDGAEKNKSAEVSIDGVRIGQDSQGRSIAIVDMTYTNTAKTNEKFFTNYDCRAYQNKVELDNALFIDGVDYGALDKTLQPGGSISISEAFILEDSSQITVEITNLLGTKTIVSKKYNIN